LTTCCDTRTLELAFLLEAGFPAGIRWVSRRASGEALFMEAPNLTRDAALSIACRVGCT
jgi:hypothetical protein